jgi:tetratricopeptide (TPR) repeat protein
MVEGALVLDGPAGVRAARRALEARRIGFTEVRETLANEMLQVLSSQNDDTVKRVLLDLTVAEMKALVERDPGNVRALTRLGALLKVPYPAEAAQYLERARAISPRRQELCFELGYVYLLLRRNAAASAMFREGWQLRPESDQARLFCALGAIQTGDRGLEDEVIEAMRRAQRSAVFYPPHRLLDELDRQRRGERLVELLEPVAAEWRQKRKPGRSISRVMRRRLLPLKNGYVLVGQHQKALDLLAEMADTEPDGEQKRKLLRLMDEVRAAMKRG